MKDKYVWSAEDVRAGMIVCRAHRRRGRWKPDGGTAKWTHKVGFIPGDNKGVPGGQYCHIALTDGLVYWRGMTKEQMAKEMTDQDMIPMPYSWWLQMVRYLRRQTNGPYINSISSSYES